MTVEAVLEKASQGRCGGGCTPSETDLAAMRLVQSAPRVLYARAMES